MPPSIPSLNRFVQVDNLTDQTFAQFGTVIQNPSHSPHPPSAKPKDVIEANQGSALKYIDIIQLSNFYPRKESAKPVVNMFVCKPRKLRSRTTGVGTEKVFDIGILERHPYTPQAFIPIGLARSDKRTKYLVIVAPTLSNSREEIEARPKPYPVPDSKANRSSAKRGEIESRPRPYPVPEPKPKRSLWDIFSRARPSPYSNSKRPPSFTSPVDAELPQPKGTGLPDLENLHAFIADGSQAVTYGPGTWHAPMVVIGDQAIDFVVLQYANGVANDDCQEVILESKEGEGVSVVVEVLPTSLPPVRAKL